MIAGFVLIGLGLALTATGLHLASEYGKSYRWIYLTFAAIGAASYFAGLYRALQ